jgi:hypothetical protein
VWIPVATSYGSTATNPISAWSCRARPVNRSPDQEVLDVNRHAAGER